MTAILRLDGLTKSFGAIKVADDQSFELVAGDALGVIGPCRQDLTVQPDHRHAQP